METNSVPENEKKYKVELANMYVGAKVHSDTPRDNREIERNGRKGIFKPTLNVRKKDLKITKRTASEYGEFIASKIAQKIGLPTCEVEMVKRRISLPYSATGKTADIPGCISYLDLQEGESLSSAIFILSWFKTEKPEEYFKIVTQRDDFDKEEFNKMLYTEKNHNNIELVRAAFKAYVLEKCNSTEEKWEEIEQSLVDMVVFDCALGNRDRNDENYGLSIDRDGNPRFYPIFDNEYILGFSEVGEDIQKYSAARLQEHIDKDLYSRMGISSQPTQISPSAMMTYLFTSCPEKAQKAYEKISQFTDDDLIEIMEECEGLPELHKEYALRIFRFKRREMRAIQKEYIDDEGNIRPQGVLPGDKPMELIPRRSGSKSPRIENIITQNSKNEREAPVIGE